MNSHQEPSCRAPACSRPAALWPTGTTMGGRRHMIASALLLLAVSAHRPPPTQAQSTAVDRASGSPPAAGLGQAPQDNSPSASVIGPQGPPTQGRAAKADEPALPDDSDQHKRFTLTIAGGLSLGNYEAGLNWALVNERKRSGGYELSAATGASAGAINALLSALEWCAIDRSTATGNLLEQVWLPVGLKNMLPPNGPKTVTPVDGISQTDRSTQPPAPTDDLVLSRQVSHIQARRIVRRFTETTRFDDHCGPIQLAFSVTGEKPNLTTRGKAQARSNYYVIPITMTVRNGKPRFVTNYAFIRNRVDGKPRTNAIGLGAEGQILSLDTVFDAVVASSAFPVAFGPVQLAYSHAHGSPCNGANCAMYFSDGGLFDNVPLGLARELDPDAAEHIYFDPEVPRKEVGSCKRIKNPDGQDTLGPIARTLGIVSESLRTARSRVLLDTLQKMGETDKPSVPNRFAPITGTLVGKFGAWLDSGFRQYDYWMGIYDGLYHASGSPSAPTFQSTLSAKIDQVVESEHDRDFLHVAQRIERLWATPTDGAQLLAAVNEMPTVRGADTGHLRLAILRSVLFRHHLGADGQPRVPNGFCHDEASLGQLVSQLDRANYPISKVGSEFLHSAKDRVKNWWIPIAARAVDRLANVDEDHFITDIAGVAHAVVYPSDPKQSWTYGLGAQSRLRSRLAEYQLVGGLRWISETGSWRVEGGPYASLVANSAPDWRLGGHLDLTYAFNPLFAAWVQGQVAYGLRSKRPVAGTLAGITLMEVLKVGGGVQWWLERPEERWSQQSGGDLFELSFLIGIQLDTIARMVW